MSRPDKITAMPSQCCGLGFSPNSMTPAIVTNAMAMAVAG
jgi:hypothetical protein